MDALTSKPQERTGMPPEEAFWKALAMVGITSLAVWSAIWGFVGFRIGLQGDEWPAGLILFVLTVLFLTPVLYHNYRRGSQTRKSSRRVNILLGICALGVSVGNSIEALQWPKHNQWWHLAAAFAWLLFAANYFHRAFKPAKTDSLPS